jgi:PAS domain S-box-containing protein
MDRYQEEIAQIKELLKQNPQGMTVTEISRRLGKNMHSVGRYLDVLRASGQVDMRQFGMAKVFSLSRRMPISMMLSTASEMMMVLDSDLRVIQVNDRFLQFLQMPRDEMVGKNIEYLPIADAGIHELVAGAVGALHAGKTHEMFHLPGEAERYFMVKIIQIVFEDGSGGFAVIMVDITAHKMAEKALRESEHKYRELVENANSIILKMDTDGNITFFNEFAETFFGFTQEEIIGKNVIGTIVPPTEETGRDLAALMEGIRTDADRFQNNENENITRDGRRVWIRWTNRAIFDEGGNPAGALCIGTDITERKVMEEQIRASEERFRDLADMLPQPVFEADLSGTITYANRRACTIFGSPADDARSAVKILDLIAPEDRERAERSIRRIVAEGVPSQEEYTALRMDGTTLPIMEYSNPITRAGRVTGLRGIAIDLSEQKAAERALREERDLISAVLDTVDALILVLDNDRRIVRFNRACEELTGYAAEEVLGRPALDLFLPAEDQERVNATLQRLVAGEAPCHVRNAWILRDGSTRVIDWSNTVLKDRSGDVAYIIGTGIDITGRMELEEDLRTCRQQVNHLLGERRLQA